MLVAGGSLSSVSTAMQGVYQLLHKKQQDTLMRINRPFLQEVLNLMGATETSDPLELSGTIMNEVDEIQHATETSDVKVLFCIYLCQAELAFYLHKFKRAKALIQKCISFGAIDMIITSLTRKLIFLDAMTSIAISWACDRDERAPKEAAKRKKKHMATVSERLATLEDLARFAPENLMQKVYLIKAEVLAIDGDITGAMALFKKSMEHAEQNGCIVDKTLACERAGLALRQCGKQDDSLDYLEDCCGFYREWGALIKVNHVKGNVIPQAIHDWDE
jgi:hypothetical protein